MHLFGNCSDATRGVGRPRIRRRGRKSEESRWRRWCRVVCVCGACEEREREETGGKWDGGRASAKRRDGAGAGGALARGAAACAHRRALHSACTFERCGWDARVCWRERVTGSRVRQLQPRLLAQWFSILSSSQQHVRFCIEPPPPAITRRRKLRYYCYWDDVFFIAIVRAVYNYGTKRQKFTLKCEL